MKMIFVSFVIKASTKRGEKVIKPLIGLYFQQKGKAKCKYITTIKY